MHFNIDVYTTHITVDNSTEASDLIEPLLARMIYEDTYATDEILKERGYIFDDDTDTLYLHRGVDLSYLQRLLINCKVRIHEHDEFDNMEYQFEEVIPPRDQLQVDIIDFFKGVNGHANSYDKNQLLLQAGTGTGKTFTASYGACSLSMKTIIFVHTVSLIKQWYCTLIEKHGFPSNRIHLLSTDDLYLAACGRHKCDADVYIVTHQTFRSAMKKCGSFTVASNMLKNLRIGLKIIDECHLMFGNILLIDFLSNVYKTFYLSATPGRSNKDDNSIFKYVFSSCIRYKRSELSSESIIPKRWVSYNVVSLNTETPYSVYKHRVLARGNSMNAISYGKFVIQRDQKQTHFKCIRDILKQTFTKDENSKVIVFVPLIDLVENLTFFLQTQLSYDDSFPYDLKIRSMTSRNTKEEKDYAKKADVIVTTIQSCGTGVDLPGLTTAICSSPFVSPLTAEQVFGRLRYCGKKCFYYDIIDTSIPMDINFWRSRRKTFDRLALEVHSIGYELDPDEEDKK